MLLITIIALAIISGAAFLFVLYRRGAEKPSSPATARGSSTAEPAPAVSPAESEPKKPQNQPPKERKPTAPRDRVASDPQVPVEAEDRDIRDYLTPEEAGTYHNASLISETGLQDLERALVEPACLPAHLAKLLDVLNDPFSSAGQVAEICERDAGLTTRVLKVVNSPFYGLGQSVDDLRLAVSLLGFDEIRMLLLVGNLFGQRRPLHGSIPVSDLWSHSLATSRISTWLAWRSGVMVRERLAGTAAILHDVGKIVLQTWRPERMKRAIDEAKEKRGSLMSLECSELGITHALAGELLLARLKLPVRIRSVVKECHLPVCDPDLPESAIVYLAGQVAKVLNIGDDGEPVEEQIPQELREFLTLEPETVSELLGEDFEEFVRSALADVRLASPV